MDNPLNFRGSVGFVAGMCGIGSGENSNPSASYCGIKNSMIVYFTLSVLL